MNNSLDICEEHGNIVVIDGFIGEITTSYKKLSTTYDTQQNKFFLRIQASVITGEISELIFNKLNNRINLNYQIPSTQTLVNQIIEMLGEPNSPDQGKQMWKKIKLDVDNYFKHNL